MSFHNNPFIRGYWGLRVQRMLEIIVDENSPSIYRPLHQTQAHLPDHEVVRQSCSFRDEYALVASRRIPDRLISLSNEQGFVHAVRYAIYADDEGQPVHLGDAHSPEQANEVIRRLTFETGTYSRCWEISTRHLDRAALDYLEAVLNAAMPMLPFLYVFKLPGGIIEMKLIGTPWNDAHLYEIDGPSVDELRLAHLEKGMPRSLVNVLHLAGEADVRILIFDDGAPKLHGLPVYEH